MVTQLSREYTWNNAYQRLFKEGDLFLVEENNMKQSLMEIGCSSEKIVIQHIGVDTEKIQFKERPSPAEKDTIHARHLYTPLLDIDKIRTSRDTFQQALHNENIGTGIHFRGITSASILCKYLWI